MSITKFTVYQTDNPELMFRVDKNKTEYNLNDYKKVFEMEWNYWDLPEDKVVLEALFDLLNGEVRPSKFTGHSMSVGDIVTIDDRAYICDIVGWKKINLK